MDHINFSGSTGKCAVIFDCDGVMFDSRQANINYYNHLLAHFNLPPMNDSDVSFVHMHTADKSIKQIFRGTPFVEKANAYRLEMNYLPFIKDMVIEPGLRELLSLIRPLCGLAVATNRSNTIEDVLQIHGISQYFDIVVSSLDVKKPKPNPESLFKILDFFDLIPTQSIYIGDSIIDLDTAKAADVPFISYKNKGLKAERNVDGMEELGDIIINLNSFRS